MNTSTILYQPILTLDDLTTIRVALDQRAEWAEKIALDMSTMDGYHYFAREARIARRIERKLLDAHYIDLDDMERHATR